MSRFDYLKDDPYHPYPFPGVLGSSDRKAPREVFQSEEEDLDIVAVIDQTFARMDRAIAQLEEDIDPLPFPGRWDDDDDGPRAA